jgi:predicted nuclease of predicted toxin-antitoxin system
VAEAVPFLTDNQIRGPLITALRQAGYDVVRAVDLFGQENDDAELFEHAAGEGRVFLTCDEGIHAIAHGWLSKGRIDFRMIYCTMANQQDMTVGDLVKAVEEILRKADAFAYPIEYVKRRP